MVRWLIRAGVSGVVVAILLWLVPIDAVLDALRRVSVWTWAACVAVFFAGHYLNALKLRLLIGDLSPDLKVRGSIGWSPGALAPGNPLMSACVRAQYAGLVANLGLPGLAGGDLVRAAYLAPLIGLKRVAIASVTDRLIDTATVIALIAIALPMAGMPVVIAGVVGRAGLWLAAGATLGLVGALLVARMRRFAGVRATVATAWTALRGRQADLLGAVAISFAVQSAFVLANVWLARQVGVTTGLAAWFVAWPMSKLIAVLPISLGGIGVREAALVSLLAPYGAPREAVLASGILWQAVLIVTGLAGLVITQLLKAGPSGPSGPSGPAGSHV